MSYKEPPKLGTCYVDVFNYFMYENEIPDMKLVHGVLVGRDGLKGWVYGN